MAIEMLSIQWKNEDELPDMTDFEYDLCFQTSRIINGVRMFPFVRDWDDENECERIIFLYHTHNQGKSAKLIDERK